jgi:TrmH family RNA methyltransferase
MLTKATIKLVQSLNDKKCRNEHGLFLVEGTKTVHELLASKIKVKTLFATADWFAAYKVLLDRSVEQVVVNERELKQLSNLMTPRQVVALAHIPEYAYDTEQILSSFVIALDGIQDPGNMGTIIRIADWYGIEHIICSPQCADVYNPKVLQASMGSFIRTSVLYTDLATFLESCSSIPVYGALMQGKSLYETKLGRSGIILIGNEGAGISGDLLKFVTQPVTIPRRGEAESLNAAVAAAVICDAWGREMTMNHTQ